ncbi:Rrf2 family transcriptional regulator [bacterium]|nr:Rrf2 family transcriptional regulator [bacterium]
MLLPQTSQYALRAMACLAALPPGESINSRDLAEVSAIPRRFLSKVMRSLVVAGLVSARKGHHGGFVLARPTKSISFTEILDATHFTMDPTHCAFGFKACDEKNPCPLHPAWKELKEIYGDWAAGTTLSSTVRKKKPAPRGKGSSRRVSGVRTSRARPTPSS